MICVRDASANPFCVPLQKDCSEKPGPQRHAQIITFYTPLNPLFLEGNLEQFQLQIGN